MRTGTVALATMWLAVAVTSRAAEPPYPQSENPTTPIAAQAVDTSGQATEAATATQIAAGITAANAFWADGIRRQDPAMLAHVMAPEYRLTFENSSKRVDLASWMRNFMTMKMHGYNPSITALRLIGPDTVVATVVSDWDATLSNGKSVRETFVAHDTWAWRGDRWISTGRHVIELKRLDEPEKGTSGK